MSIWIKTISDTTWTPVRQPG